MARVPTQRVEDGRREVKRPLNRHPVGRRKEVIMPKLVRCAVTAVRRHRAEMYATYAAVQNTLLNPFSATGPCLWYSAYKMLKTGPIASSKTPGFWQLGFSNILEMIAKTINYRVTESIQSPKRIAPHNRGRKFAQIA